MLVSLHAHVMARLIAHASVRYATMSKVRRHPFFDEVEWDDLRASDAPFIPALDSEVDTGYYDNFTSPEDMAKYAEVQAKKKHVDSAEDQGEPISRGVWVGFTFGKNGPATKTVAQMLADPSAGDSELATIF